MKPGLLKKAITLLNREKLTADDLEKRLNSTGEEIEQLLDVLQKNNYDLLMEANRDGARYYIRNTSNASSLVLSPKSNQQTHQKILLITDTHAGCKHFDKKGLENVLKEAKKEGVETAYFAGDAVDGRNVYRGQIEELKYIDESDQVDDLGDVFSSFPKLKIYCVRGNHDSSWDMLGAPSPLAMLAERVPNVVDMQSVKANIVLDGILIQLVHGAGGVAYAASYPAQKYLRNLAEQGTMEQNVNGVNYPLKILHLGHYHRQANFAVYGTHVFHAGSFQKAESEYSIRRGFVSIRGGYVLDMDIKRGKILRLLSQWIDSGT